MNAGKITGANFVDLLKAFDTRSNSQIIANRSRCGITVMERELFTDYLFSRKQQVSYSSELSPLKSVAWCSSRIQFGSTLVTDKF